MRLDSNDDSSRRVNPLRFATHGLEEISLTIDNQTERYVIDEQTNNYLLLYQAIAERTGCDRPGNDDEGHLPVTIKYEQLLKEYAFFPFDISPTRGGSDFSKPRVGNVRVDPKFRDKFAEPLELLCFFENTRVFWIDKARKVTPST